MPKAKPTKLTQSSLSFNNVKKTAASSSKNLKARSPAVTVRKSTPKADIEVSSDDDDDVNKSEIVSSIRPSSPKPKKGMYKHILGDPSLYNFIRQE